jgi:1-deoxy-D-xylulose-5-phosphate reductoisomerase
MEKILLLGSTGSIGKSTENVVARYRDRFEIIGISVNNRVDSAIDQIKEFGISYLSIGSPEAASKFPQSSFSSVTMWQGDEGLLKMAEELDYDIMVNALVGSVGFAPTAAALKRGKTVALANKESLVVGGELINDILKECGGKLLPVDSEHSAILQCLNGEDEKTIEMMTITASGGPFRDLPISEFKNITVETALKHPTWAMGPKITIDSSTLMNKGFEIIEAHHIFQLPYDQIEALVHPQSIIHSMVTFTDGAVMAQCGLPDMELPIQYALTFPERLPINSPRMNLAEIGKLTFETPDMKKFPCLGLCLEAGKEGGTMPAVLNAANEVAVELFLNKQIEYTQIADAVAFACYEHKKEKSESVEQILAIDIGARELVRNRFGR